MNCVIIQTDLGPYCESHRTWHEEETMNEPDPVLMEWTHLLRKQFTQRLPLFQERTVHSCQQQPDGQPDTCPACREEKTDG